MSVTWLDYKGTRILYADYRECASVTDELAVLEEQGRQLRLRPVKSLLLSNFEGVSVGSGYMNEVKKRGAASASRFIARNAVLGVTGLKAILLEGYIAASGMRDRMRAFDNEQAALDWLVS